MESKIIDYLKWTEEEYEDRVLFSYWQWCQTHGIFESITQQLFASSSINKWFLIEYGKLEKKFIMIAEATPNTPKQLEAHYKACTADIGDLFPKALIEKIIRNKEFSSAIINDKLTYYAN